MLYLALHSWEGVIRRKIAYRKRLDEAQRRQHQRIARLTMVSWVHYASSRKQKSMAINYRTRRQQLLTLQHWKHRVQLKKQQRRIVEATASHLKDYQRAKVLAKWREWAAVVGGLRHRIRQLRYKADQRLLKSSWDLLLLWTKDSVRLRWLQEVGERYICNKNVCAAE